MTAGRPPVVPGHDTDGFIRANTAPIAPPLVPEIALLLAHEVTPLWEATEAELVESGLPPPFWAFAWAGGQAIARYLLDEPQVVAGKSVLDFGSGSGLVAIAAAKAGAASVLACDIDRFAAAAIAANAALNGVRLDITTADLVGRPVEAEIVCAGDVCYERAFAEGIVAWLRGLARDGHTVLLGDPGRTFMPKTGVEWIRRYAVQTTREIEDTDVRNAVVWRVLPE